MQNSVVLQRTGDFWIDLGLVRLWTALSSRSSDNPSRVNGALQALIPVEDDPLKNDATTGLSVTLSSTALCLEYDDDKILNRELSLAIESIRPDYLGRLKSGKIWWQGLGRVFFSNQTDIQAFFELPTTVIQKEKKQNWKIGFCDFCGSNERHIRKAGSAVHPLIVVPGKFSSFYSNLIGDTRICNWCSFVAKFSPLRLFFKRKGRSVSIIAMESANLMDLEEVFIHFSSLFTGSDFFGNFSSVLRYTQYPLENLLDFLFATIREIQRRQDSQGSNLLRSGAITRVHIIQGISGQGLSIGRYYVIPNMPIIFDFITSCNWLSKELKSYNSLFETAKFLIVKRKKDVQTITREEFSRRVFYNKDVTGILEQFLITNLGVKYPFKNFAAINVDRFISIYMLNQMAMDSNQLRVAQSIGDMIGTFSAEHEKSLLYDLRSIGNLDSLNAFFNQMLVRYLDDYPKPDIRSFETLLEEINNTNWRTYKSLIGIYAALKYTELKEKEERQQRQNQKVQEQIVSA